MEMQPTYYCCSCGGEIEHIDGHGGGEWIIGMKWFSFWNRKGDERVFNLCSKCGWKAALLLGFQTDAGKILSLRKKEGVTSVNVYGPHGGGLSDIALGGIAGASPAQTATGKPDNPPMRDLSKLTDKELHDLRNALYEGRL